MTRDEMETRLRNLLERITHARDCFELYRYLLQCREKYLDLMNISPGFFQLVEYSLNHTFLIELAKIYDDRKDNKTGLKKLLNQCKQNQSLFMLEYQDEYIDVETDLPVITGVHTINVLADISLLEAEMENLVPILDNLKARRDKWYAHLDKAYEDGVKLSEDFPLSFNDVDQLFAFADKVCNRLLMDLTRGVFLTKSTNALDLRYTFDQLEKDRE